MIAVVDAVYIHAWKFYEDGQEYCEEHENPDGWCVYARTEPDELGCFEGLDEKDFPTHEAAYAYARALSEKYNNAEIRPY